MKVTVDPSSAETLRKAFEKALSAGRTKQLFTLIGDDLAEKAKDNCDSRGRGGFWQKIRDSISATPTDGGVEVGSTYWVAPHVQFGGPISAPGKGEGSEGRNALTIPISPKSKGKRVSDFDRKKIVKIDNVLFLKVGKKKMEPLFVLCKRTKPQAPRPFMPWESEVDEIAGKAAALWMKVGLAQ